MTVNKEAISLVKEVRYKEKELEKIFSETKANYKKITSLLKDGVSSDLFLNFYYLDKKGLLHHESLPALIIEQTKDNIKTIKEYYYLNGILFRKNAPAFILSHLEGENMNDSWYNSYEYHYHECHELYIWSEVTEELVIFLSKETSSEHYIDAEDYFLNSYRHRENNYSYQKISQNGEFYIYHYEKNGKFHREDGPAYIENDGSEVIEDWYLEGNLIQENEI